MYAGQPHRCHWEMGSQSLREAGEVRKLHPWRLSEAIWLMGGCGQLGLTPRSAPLGAGGRGRDGWGDAELTWRSAECTSKSARVAGNRNGCGAD